MHTTCMHTWSCTGTTHTRADDTHVHTHPTSAQDKCAGSSTQQLTDAHAIAIMKRARAHTLPHARSHTGVEKPCVQVDMNFVAGQHINAHGYANALAFMYHRANMHINRPAQERTRTHQHPRLMPCMVMRTRRRTRTPRHRDASAGTMSRYRTSMTQPRSVLGTCVHVTALCHHSLCVHSLHWLHHHHLQSPPMSPTSLHADVAGV